MLLAAAFTLLVFAYSLVSRKLDGTPITAPILFTAAGALMLLFPDTSRALFIDRKALLLIAEVGLVMTLFTDASHISRKSLQDNHRLPVRLLSVGMLLTILLGAVAAMACFAGLSWWEAGILAAILAPTDAGLGQVIVNSPLLPARIRQALNVEAGLNDGLAVPFLMLFIALAAAVGEGAGARGVLARFLLEQIGYGTAIGLAVGLIGGLLMGLAQRRQWMSPELGQLGVVAMPLLCILAAEESGASMFIAAFVAGLAAQVGFPKVGRHSVEFTEGWGQLFNFFVFFLFGLLCARNWHDFTPLILVYALFSLTVVRMLPVALAVAGIGLSRATVFFIGWFGPRGLASIVLGLVYLEQRANLPGEDTIRLAVTATVLLSVVAHGLSAKPGIGRYARSCEALPPEAPEHAAGDGPVEK
ncbi:cation:proton antiporter [Accumulibacter sp.]|uniref:cation:proton antiporter n=1 Tax=Accumulibacter sp. TaxID=2053492 RepID=UPI0025F2BCD2|nr:cation:proton antiporter [Accumulibacter sp.]MCP5229354.1 cation:proton antiporter [Accumulibacter sp.]